MNARSCAIAVSLLAGLGVSGYFVFRAPPPSAAPTTTAPANVETESEVAPVPEGSPIDRTPGCTFAAGTNMAYSLVASVGASLEGSPEGVQTTHRSARATLDLEVLSANEKGAVLLAKYRDVDTALTAEAGELTSPFLLRVDSRCAITGYAHLDKTAMREGRAQQALAYSLIWSWPEKEASTRNERNDHGELRAAYRDLSGKRPRVERRVQAYTHVWSDDWQNAFADSEKPEKAAARKEEKPVLSLTTIEPGAGPWFETLTGTERIRAAGAELTSSMSARSVAPLEGAFSSAPRAESRYVWEDLLSRRVRPRTAPPVSKREQAEIAEVKKLSLAEAMTRYRKHVDANENIAQTWPHLKAYLVARPEAATELGTQIRKHELPEEGSAGVFIALGATPTTEARDALLGVKNDTSVQVFDRARAAFALVDRADVGIELARQFRSESQAITAGTTRMERLYGRHAALALGVMGSVKASDDPAIAEETRGAARDILRRGKTATHLRPGFGTLANLGDPSMLSEVAPFLRSADPAVRTAAAISFRRMPPARTLDMVIPWLAAETDAGVKRELYRVVQLQHHDAKTVADRALVAQAIADLSADPAPGILTRQSILNLLGEAKDDYPEAKAALIASVPREMAMKDDGGMDILTKYLTGDEIAAGLPRDGR